MNLKYGTDKTELIKLSPMLLYEIATDIQVTDKWKQFAMLIGFTNEQITMLQLNCGDRFPAENVIYHWFSKNPRVDNLAEHLCTLLLERPLIRLKNHLNPLTFAKLLEKLQLNRNCYTRPINNETTDGYLESIHNVKINEIAIAPVLQQQHSNPSPNSTTDPLIPEPGIVDGVFHHPSIPRSLHEDNGNYVTEENRPDNNSGEDSSSKLFESMLKETSTTFSPEEFTEIDSVGRSLQGKFSSHFNLKLRSNDFYIRAFSLQKVMKSPKKKKKLYNIIWFLTHFKLNRFPLLTGFSFYDDNLFLLFPFQNCHLLYDILHRPHDAEYKTISAQNRLDILISVGKGLAFLHESHPFRGFHGQVTSSNVLISNQGATLTGFDKFCTQQPSYLKGLESIKKSDIDFEKCFRKDIIQYLELICETWWNVQPSSAGGGHTESFLIKDIVRRNIVIPKQKYSDWNDGMNEQIRELIEHFCENTKELGSIAEIVEQLSGDIREPVASLEPPPYESWTGATLEYKPDNQEYDSED